MIFVFFVAIANYNIYLGTVDYMVAAYGPYSASATGGNALARDVLAGAAAMYAGPFYRKFPRYPWTLIAPTLILAGLSVLFLVSLYWIYVRGPTMRKNSKMAEDIGHRREIVDQRRHTLKPEEVRNIEAALRSRVNSVVPTRQHTPEPNSDEATRGSEGFGPEHGTDRTTTAETRREVSEIPTSTEDTSPTNVAALNESSVTGVI